MTSSIPDARSESDKSPVQCGVCGKLCNNGAKYGYCNRTPACRKARNKAYYAANKQVILGNAKKRYAEDSSQILERAAAYREANRALIRIRKRDIAYGLKPGEFDQMLAAQGGRCKGCGEQKRVYVDHDHACCPKQPTCGNCNRGLLCEQCNWVLGFAKDSPEILRALAGHLEESMRDLPLWQRDPTVQTQGQVLGSAQVTGFESSEVQASLVEAALPRLNDLAQAELARAKDK